MKLVEVRINEYKCIRDTNPFVIDDITCLVGKNEAGKTAILEALYRLNPIIENHGEFDFEEEYPRMDVEDYRIEVKSGERNPAVIVTAKFQIEENDKNSIDNDFPNILKDNFIELTKGYDNCTCVSLNVIEENVVRVLLKQASVIPEEMKEIEKTKTIEELNKKLTTFESSESNTQLLQKILKIKKMGIDEYFYSEYLEGNIPKFLYFNEYYKMEGQVNIDSLLERKKQNKLEDSDRPLLALIELSRIKFEELLHPEKTQSLLNRLEGASNHISKKLLKYWSQNKNIELKFDIRNALPQDPEGMQKAI